MLEYNEAKIISRKIAKENKIKTSKEWKQYCSNNKIILPANPREYYNDFISWMDWLGTDKKRNILIHDNFLTFDEAREYTRKLNLKSTQEWKIWIKSKPDFIPSLPYNTYKNEWISWYDWLGYDNKQFKSYGISKIISILEYNNIAYKQEKTFELCKNKLKLPFDFYLLDYNILIEYDGEQHYNILNHFGGEKTFNRIKINDDIKTNFCIEHNIKLLRISYKDMSNIYNILSLHITNIIDSKLIKTINNTRFIKFEDAKKEINNKFKTLEHYRKYIKENDIDYLPLYPNSAYENKYTSSQDYLGVIYYTYEEAKFNTPISITSGRMFNKYYNDNIEYRMPKHPDKFYNEWTGWANFLNKNKTKLNK